MTEKFSSLILAPQYTQLIARTVREAKVYRDHSTQQTDTLWSELKASSWADRLFGERKRPGGGCKK